MPRPPLPGDVAALLARPNPAVMATIHPDGYPVSVATWYLVDDDGTILLSLDAERARLRHLRANPQVSLTALAEGDWYTHVSVQGPVVSITEDGDLAGVDRIATHYTGHGYPVRDRPRVIARVQVAHWHGWGAANPDS